MRYPVADDSHSRRGWAGGWVGKQDGFQDSGLGLEVEGSGVRGCRFVGERAGRVQGVGCRVQGVEGVGSRVTRLRGGEGGQGLRFRVSGVRVSGFRFRVSGSGFRVGG